MNIKVQETADRLLNRIGVSTCSFTTVKAAKRTLEEEGACVLSMQKPHWDLEPGKTYLVTVGFQFVCIFYRQPIFGRRGGGDRPDASPGCGAHRPSLPLYQK